MGDFKAKLSDPFVHRGFAGIYRTGNSGNGVVLIEYRLGSFKANLRDKIASVTSNHNITCYD